MKKNNQKKPADNYFRKIDSHRLGWTKMNIKIRDHIVNHQNQDQEEYEETKIISISTVQTIVIIGCVTLLILPFVTTFNEFITRLFMKIELYQYMQNEIVPFQVRMVTGILNLIGIDSTASLSRINMMKGQTPVDVFISWNCIGWQSFILLFISMFVGLRGPFTINSKIETILIGVLGTALINIIRIFLVAIIAYLFGQLPAVIFHDYVSTIVIILWLIAFWYFSHQYILHHTDFVKIRAHKLSEKSPIKI